MVRELGAVRRLVDALAGKAAVRIDETSAYRRACDRSAADTLAKAFGVGTGEARRLKETAEKLSAHPGVDAEVRAGRLPARDAHLIAEALALAPEAEQRLMSAARQGHRALRAECVKVRAAKEDAAERVRRQHKARSFRMWTDHDGMVAGAFRLAPEVGGPITKWFDAAVEKVFQARRPGEEHEPHEAYAADVFAALFDGWLGADESAGAEETGRRTTWWRSTPGPGGRPASGEEPACGCTSSSTTRCSCAARPARWRRARSPGSGR